MSVIGVDIDGVLRNIVPQCCKVYKQNYDINSNIEPEDLKEWNMCSIMPKIKDHDKFFTDNSRAIFVYSKQYPEYEGLTKRIQEEGHKVAIITHQCKGTEKETLEWLALNNVPYDSVHFCKDKTTVNADVLIDDGSHNLRSFADYNKTSVCISRPWNEDWKGIRVHSKEEVMNYLRRYNEN